MEGRVATLIHFIILTIILVVVKLFYPILNFSTSVNIDSEVILRLLASYSYYDSLRSYQLLILINICLLFGFSIFYLLQDKSVNKNYFTSLTIVFVIFTLLFWMLSVPRSNSNGETLLEIPDLYWLWSGLHLLFLIIGFLGFFILEKILLKPVSTPDLKTITQYECPWCHHLFEANVSYCPFCKKQIETQIFVKPIN